MPDQRVIKFRLIYKGKIVGYEWHPVAEGYIAIFHSPAENHTDSFPDWGDIIDSQFFIDHDHKDQFTGLTDVDGKEIYENDKLLEKLFSGCLGEAIVKWHDTGWCMRFIEGSYEPLPFPEQKLQEIKAIGNIWEDKEE